ncbi:hypothetical protein CBR_g19782 [Chara braunii]|uniref:Phospholipid/glycerol acyltransferase domain-containing protein n=1 Tax=Chara braunii TaxID=69332 RepID=A0A388JTZ5_CHABU|nr:hypothetical protein CBR_g19782 [Chara braunii]|eukprot:GBG61250.1 hypothetical protein CBR_g19782 [Chara braunii]
MEEQQRFGIGIWSLKERFKERLRQRLRFSPRHQFHLLIQHQEQQAQSRQSAPTRRASAKAAVATSLAAARVFKGNAVLARFAAAVVRGHWYSGPKKSGGEHWRARAAIQMAKPPAFKGFGSGSGSRSRLGSAGSTTTEAGAKGATVSSRANVAVGAREASAVPRVSHVETGGGVPPSSTTAAAGTTSAASLLKDTESDLMAQRAGREERKLADVALVENMLTSEQPSLWMKAAQGFAVPVFGALSRIFMHGLNRTEVFDAHKLADAIWKRPQGQPLITVCNHVASMDDPLVLAALVPPDLLVHAWAMRWTLCATDRCFTNPVFSAFFQSAKVLPIVRGAGLEQKGVDVAIGKLNKGDWVHIFPEGSRSRDGGRTLGSMKRGIGRLVLDAKETPMVVPFIHKGMEAIIPVGQSLPKVGKKIAVLVGDPIPIDDLMQGYRSGLCSQAEVYRAVAARVGRRMNELKGELDARLEHAAVLEEQAVDKNELGGWTGVRESWELLDWQAQGMGVFDTEALLASSSENSCCVSLPRQLDNGSELSPQGMQSPSSTDEASSRHRGGSKQPSALTMPPSATTSARLPSTTIHSEESDELLAAPSGKAHRLRENRNGIGSCMQTVDHLSKTRASELNKGLDPAEEESALRREANSWPSALEMSNGHSLGSSGDDRSVLSGQNATDFDDGDTWFSELYEVDSYRWGRWSSSSRNESGWDMMGFAATGLSGRRKGVLPQGLTRGLSKRCDEAADVVRQEYLGPLSEARKKVWTRPNWTPLLEKAGGIYRDLREQKVCKRRSWRLIDFLRSDPAVESLGLGSGSRASSFCSASGRKMSSA